jgi:hypothetical protein
MRPGQTLFNTLLEIDPVFAESIRGGDLDPFYNDERIPGTLRAWKDACVRPLNELIVELVNRHLPHSGACVVHKDRQYVVTRESCCCSDLARRARKAVHMVPFDEDPSAR